MLNTLKTLIVIFILSHMASYGQEKTFEVTHKRNDDKTVDFYFKKKNPGSAYVIIKFNTLENTTGKRIVKKTIKGYSGSLFKLNPINTKRGITFSYTYYHMYGNRKAKVNQNFNYILPFKDGKEVRVRDLYYIGEQFGNEAPKNWKALQFLTESTDTVYASRKGIVVKIQNKFDMDAKTKTVYSFKNKSNYIVVEHADGTLAKYGVLRKNSSMVKLGDKVYPSTPIAVAGSYDKYENSQLRFSVYYLDKDVDYEFNKIQTLKNKKQYYKYLNPVFSVKGSVTKLISNGIYTAMSTNEMIQYEMTKREKKKLFKKK